MNNPSKDIRYAQTEEDLLTAFDLLCREKDPAKITVAEVSKKTGVTRSTFYNHYQDMLQVLICPAHCLTEDSLCRFGLSKPLWHHHLF